MHTLFLFFVPEKPLLPVGLTDVGPSERGRLRLSSPTVNSKRILDVLLSRVHHPHSCVILAHDSSGVGWGLTNITATIGENRNKERARRSRWSDTSGCRQYICEYLFSFKYFSPTYLHYEAAWKEIFLPVLWSLHKFSDFHLHRENTLGHFEFTVCSFVKFIGLFFPFRIGRK